MRTNPPPEIPEFWASLDPAVRARLEALPVTSPERRKEATRLYWEWINRRRPPEPLSDAERDPRPPRRPHRPSNNPIDDRLRKLERAARADPDGAGAREAYLAELRRSDEIAARTFGNLDHMAVSIPPRALAHLLLLVATGQGPSGRAPGDLSDSSDPIDAMLVSPGRRMESVLIAVAYVVHSPDEIAAAKRIAGDDVSARRITEAWGAYHDQPLVNLSTYGTSWGSRLIEAYPSLVPFAAPLHNVAVGHSSSFAAPLSLVLEWARWFAGGRATTNPPRDPDLTVVCSWCGKPLSGPPPGAGLISHGICKTCYDAVIKGNPPRVTTACRRAAMGAIEKHLVPLAAGKRPHQRDTAFFPQHGDPDEAALKGYTVGLRRALISVGEATKTLPRSRADRARLDAAARRAILRESPNPREEAGASTDRALRAAELAGDTEKIAVERARAGLCVPHGATTCAACYAEAEARLVNAYRADHPTSRVTRLIRYVRNGSGVKQEGCVLCLATGPTWSGSRPRTQRAAQWAQDHTAEHVQAELGRAQTNPRDYSRLPPISVPYDPHRVWKAPGVTPGSLSPGEIKALMRRAGVTSRDVAMASDLPLERVRELHARGALGSHAVYDMIDRINRASYAKHLDRAVDVSPIGSSEPKGHEAAGMFLGRARMLHKGAMARKASYVDAYQRLLRFVQLTPTSAPYYQALVDGLRDLGRTLEVDLKVNLGTLRPAVQPNPRSEYDAHGHLAPNPEST